MNVEDQLRAVITRQADRYPVPAPDMDGFAAGAMRRQRRQRLVVALAACFVVGIAAAGLVAGKSWWDTRGAAPIDQPTSPKQESTSSATDDRVGIIGPPPPGTPLSGPATGELVAAAALYSTGTWVYADGRIINAWKNFDASDTFRGFMVRQLTPSGVEAMRSFLVDGTTALTPVSDLGNDTKHPGGDPKSSGLFVRDGDRLMHVRDFRDCENEGSSPNQGTWVGCPGITDPDWLPSSAWEDPTFRPFVPHSYQVCLGADGSGWSPAEVLPAEAVDLLLGPENPLARHTPARGVLCTTLADSVARGLADVMDQAGSDYPHGEGDLELSYGIPGNGYLMFLPVLPHGGTYGPGG